MGKAETIRTTKRGKTELRLVAKDGRFFGMIDGVVRISGEDSEAI